MIIVLLPMSVIIRRDEWDFGSTRVRTNSYINLFINGCVLESGFELDLWRLT